jgi:hypothetical protein
MAVNSSYIGMHSPRGAKTTVTLYTLMESCKRSRLDPYRYMRQMTQAQLAGRQFPVPESPSPKS